MWWLRLGIQIERIKPGHPQQNGRHERMHLTLKREATKPAAANVLQQQARFDDFLTRYNTDRPHQALGMKVPADLYARSARVYRGLEELTYPFHDQTIMVTGCGRICFRGRKVNLSHVFAGQRVGVTQVGEHIWLVTFMCGQACGETSGSAFRPPSSDSRANSRCTASARRARRPGDQLPSSRLMMPDATVNRRWVPNVDRTRRPVCANSGSCA